jgi:glycosyltransferase involved in cell wall biosynthesis
MKGGVETFNYYLSKIFPELQIISYEEIFKKYPRVERARKIQLLDEPLRAYSCARELLRRFDDYNADVIFANGMFGWYLTLQDPGIPVVNIHHGSYAGYADYTIKRHNVGYFKTKYFDGFFERMSGYKNKNISVSQFTAHHLLKYYHISSTVISNGVNLQIFAPKSQSDSRELLGLPNDKQIAIFVGRPEYAKGFDIVLELARELKNILFLSITDRNYGSGLKNMIVKSNIPNKDLVDYYSSADVLIFPSRYEGCSYVPMEAMACGIPVIVSRVGSFYSLQNGDFGEIVDKNDVKMYSGSIQRVLNQKSRYDPRKFAADNFSFDQMAKNYTGYLKEVVKND